MRKLMSLAVAAAMLCMALCACGAKQAPFEPQETAKTLLETSGVFSEELEQLDRAVLDAFYGIEESDGVTEAASYCSTGATAEEVTVLSFAGEKEAQAFQEKALVHIDAQKEANEGYRPQEIPKLDQARVEQREASLLILVCADQTAAEAALD